MRILKEDAAAMIIDYQSRLYPFIHENEQLTINSAKLIEGLKILGIPMIVTEQYPKGIGYTIPEIQNALGDYYAPMEKMSFSCCGDENIMRKLNSLKKKNILVCGIESHVCVLQTVIDLQQSAYRAVVIADCVSSRKRIMKSH
jgi:nicotinamidase-related amidase